jgi:hypothetical protein
VSNRKNVSTQMDLKSTNSVMVPAYDNPIVWEGHSSMVREIKKQLQQAPDAIFCSVGGGGLLGGIIVGCKAVGWDHGMSESLHGSLKMGDSLFLQCQLWHSEQLVLIASIDQWHSTGRGSTARTRLYLQE